MKLNAATIRNTLPGVKPLKLFDGGGLFLLVNPSGSRGWRFKYRFEGKEYLLSVGVYPDVSLKNARERRDDLRRQIAAGIDPGAARKAQKATRRENAQNSFEAVAREWLNKFSPGWVESYSVKVVRRLEKNIFPWLGARQIGEILPPDVLEVLLRIEDRGVLYTTRRARSECSQIFRYAVATGRIKSDPTRDLKGAFAPPSVRHMPAITDPKKIGELMRAIAGYKGSPAGQAALKLAPLLFVRPGELRKAQWSEIDLDAALWTIPTTRMKTRKQNPQDHIVPLSTQALTVLRGLREFTSRSRYVFPSERTNERPMSENTVNAALRRLGYSGDEIVGHGFRAMARTLLDENLGIRPDIIEQQLAHVVRDSLGRAYNRTAHLPERQRMMQAWADYLEKLAGEVPTVPHGKLI